ncbi:hypothetical protein GVAV_001830 [Gurleya vavrai]
MKDEKFDFNNKKTNSLKLKSQMSHQEDLSQDNNGSIFSNGQNPVDETTKKTIEEHKKVSYCQNNDNYFKKPDSSVPEKENQDVPPLYFKLKRN